MIPTIADYAERTTSADRIIGGRGLYLENQSANVELVSVVTVAYNSSATIERTVDSIVNQTYPKIEYLVIDGASTDGTLDILRSRNCDITLWISEPDSGISDAFNKGISASTGQYIAIVNSDDWLEPTHLAVAIENIRASGADFAYGDLTLHPADGKPAYMLTGEKEYAVRLSHAMPQINHPTIVCRRTVYEKYGLFRTDLKAAMDYDWLLRTYRSGITGVYVPGMMSHMSMEGISHLNYIQGLKEVREISIAYGYPKPIAHVRFIIRLFRIRFRKILEPLLPKSVYDRIRKTINPHYTALGQGGPG